MTVTEMHNEFRISMDKVESSAYPDFLNREIDYFLTEAMHRFIKTRYGLTNIYQQGFESIQKRTEDLQAIVTTEQLVQGTNLIGDNTYTQYPSQAILLDQLTNTYYFFIKCIVTLTYNNCPRTDDLKLIPHDKWGRVMNDPYNKPENWSSVGIFESNKLIILYGNSASLDDVRLTYIRKPLDISLALLQDCELAEHTHKEIVQLAVSIAIENIQSPRVQTTINNLPNIE